MLTIQTVNHPPKLTSRLRTPRRRCTFFVALTFTLLLPFLCVSGVPNPSSSSANALPISETLSWVARSSHDLAQFDYDMTIRIRLLFFWISKDDVGGGYIRRGVAKDDPRLELFQVLFGSDPARCPKQINRWGAGTEAEWHSSPVPAVSAAHASDDVSASAFFGFMKSSRGKSVSEMQAELKKEKEQGEHAFTGILSRVEPGHTFSLVVPLNSAQDFNLNQYDVAEPLMIDKLSTTEKPPRMLAEGALCRRSGEFLGTVAELMDAAVRAFAPLEGAASSVPPEAKSLCYVHDAQVNTLSLEHVEPVKFLEAKINNSKGALLADNTFHDLLQMDFVTTHQLTGKKVYFTLLVGTQGQLRGVPVQIRYEPNWWFQVVLNRQPNTSHLTTASNERALQ
jgi:hypothetical protein